MDLENLEKQTYYHVSSCNLLIIIGYYNNYILPLRVDFICLGCSVGSYLLTLMPPSKAQHLLGSIGMKLNIKYRLLCFIC